MLSQLPCFIDNLALQGLQPTDFVECHRTDHTAVCRYVPSEHCSRTQRVFLQDYGGARNGRSNPDLPRRQLASRKGSTDTLAGMKRKRQEQLDSLGQADGQEDLADLQAVAEEASKQRGVNGIETLMKTLQKAQRRSLGLQSWQCNFNARINYGVQ